MQPLELTPSGVLATVAVLVVVAACTLLGLWQLDRHSERQARNAALAERLEAPRTTLSEAPRDTTGLTYRRVTLTGAADHDRSMVLAGRSYRGGPGVHLLTPVRMGRRGVLVKRGWLPSPDAATADLAAVELDGEVTVEGVLVPFPDIETDAGESPSFRRTWFRFDGDAMRRQLAYPSAPLYLQATSRPRGTGAPDSARDMPVLLPEPAPAPGPHLSYAIQWFSFAAIFFLGWVAVMARRGRDGSTAESAPVDPG